MRKLTGKEKILVSAIGTLLVFLALKVFVLGPVYEKTSDYSTQIQQAQATLRKYMALENNRVEILKAQKQIQGYSSLKGTDEDKSAMVMTKIESQARKSKLQILDMNSAGVVKVKGGVTLYRINLSSEGQLKNFLDFVTGIEGADILLQLEKIGLAVKDESAGLLKIDMVILGVAFA